MRAYSLPVELSGSAASESSDRGNLCGLHGCPEAVPICPERVAGAGGHDCGNVFHLLWESPRFGPADLRAAHSIELPFLIGTIKNEGQVEEVTRGEQVDTTGWFALSDRIRDMLVNFMKTGVPTEDKTVFRQFDQKHGWTTVVRSADEIFTMPMPKPERVKLMWRQVFKNVFPLRW